MRIWQASGVVRWGGFGGSVVVSGVCGLVLAEILSWMLVVASDPGAGLGIGIWVIGESG